MSAVADRNLLFGILAVQMDFITRDQLVEAMNAWVLAKQRPLGDILVERGALGADDHALLAPMVERHIAKHGGDPARSLAVLSSVVSARNALASVADAEVRASLQQVPESPQTQAKIEAPSTVVGEPPASLGTRYLIERSHARGGLGEVFVARDQELNRKVALKHIQEQHADDPARRSQFLQEGEITGALEHPGIIPIYGLGQYPDGRPFYAMRFVQGDSLLAAIDHFHRPPAPLGAGERNVAFRALLGRFLDVCNAVAYAHRRGVLHRDLKPGNIMLGEFGETLVIDWGMAKLLKATSGTSTGPDDLPPAEPVTPAHEALATVGRGAHGTPGYMSPEQAGGRSDELGPATDVYSLGAILFHILTGRPPLTKEDGDVVGRTIRGDLPSVRQLNPGSSRSLEAICRKALAFRPAERYPSVQALAADVRQWLADEPVSACREPLGVRARRWVRKHPRLVAGAAAALLVGLLGSLGGSVLLGAKNRELERTNNRLDEANTELISTNTRLDEAKTSLEGALSRERSERRRADNRTRLADQRFTVALDAFNRQVVAAHTLLSKRPGTAELRKAIMGEAVEGLQKLIREAERTQEAEHCRVLAHVALGDVYLQIDGNVSKANREYQLALGLSKRLADADPKDARAQRDLSFSFDKIGDVLLRQGKVQQALGQYREGLKIRQRLADADPKNAQAQRDLSISFDKIGNVLLRLGEAQKALEHFREGHKIAERLADADPRDAQAQRNLSLFFNRTGNVLLQQGEVQKALEHFREGRKIAQRLADADPKDALAQRDLFLSFNNIGNTLLQQGDVQKALEHFREMLKIAQRRADADPRNAQAQRDLSISFEKIGDLLLQQGKLQQALELYREDLKIVQRCADADPRDAQAQRDLCVCFDRIGNVLLRQGEVPKALEQFREGRKIAQRLVDTDPKDAEAQRALANSFNRTGDILLRQGEVQKALGHFREGHKIIQQLADAAPGNFKAQIDLVTSYYIIGLAQKQGPFPAEAAASFEKALAVLRPWQQAGKLKGTRFAAWPGIIENDLRSCQAALKALGNLDTLVKLPAEQAVPLLAMRARLLAQQGKHTDAATAADKLADLATTGEQHFFAASAFAWCSRDKANAERHAGRALSCLAKARDAGFFKDRKNVERLKTDETFKPLLSRPDFKKLLADLAAEGR
jgi:serine/threonine-protein kinase